MLCIVFHSNKETQIGVKWEVREKKLGHSVGSSFSLSETWAASSLHDWPINHWGNNVIGLKTYCNVLVDGVMVEVAEKKKHWV